LKGFALKALLSNIMALLLTVHMVFGCCWHHAHACTAGCERQCPQGHESIDTPATCQTCEGNQQSGGQEHRPADCKEVSCIFIGSLSVKVADSDRSVTHVVFTPMHQDCPSPATTPIGGYSRAVGCPQLPIRLNLILLVLLI
jgi:hypothetical protein